jgi:hypothetical protein
MVRSRRVPPTDGTQADGDVLFEFRINYPIFAESASCPATSRTQSNVAYPVLTTHINIRSSLNCIHATKLAKSVQFANPMTDPLCGIL